MAVHPIIPLLVVSVVLGILALIGFVVYEIFADIADKTAKNMEKKNVTFSKDGMKVGVRGLGTEEYVGGTQSILVKAWNYSSWPAYKSRFWNKEELPQARPGYVRAGSSATGAVREAKNK